MLLFVGGKSGISSVDKPPLDGLSGDEARVGWIGGWGWRSKLSRARVGEINTRTKTGYVSLVEHATSEAGE